MEKAKKDKVTKGVVTGRQLLKVKHSMLQLGPLMQAYIGEAQHGGSWCIKAKSFQGKTNFVAQLICDFALVQKVGYNSLEEKRNKSIQECFSRFGIEAVGANVWTVVEEWEEFKLRIGLPKTPKIWVVDSVQISGMRKSDYLRLLKQHPDVLFVFISHVDAKGEPEGALAKTIWRLSDVKIYVEGLEAFIDNRLGSTLTTFPIWQEGSDAYYANGLLKDEVLKKIARKTGREYLEATIATPVQTPKTPQE